MSTRLTAFWVFTGYLPGDQLEVLVLVQQMSMQLTAHSVTAPTV